MTEGSIADPHHLGADPDPVFHFDGNPRNQIYFDADPYPTFHSDADPDPTFLFDADLLKMTGSGSPVFQCKLSTHKKALDLSVVLFIKNFKK